MFSKDDYIWRVKFIPKLPYGRALGFSTRILMDTYGYLAKKVKERNGEGYDSVFITEDGKYLSHHTPAEILKYSARIEALNKLAAKL